MVIHPSTLGATLYVPSTRDDLLAIATGEKYPDLRSVVFDLEDSVLDRDIEVAIGKLAQLLKQLHLTRSLYPNGPLLFVRPRNAELLRRISRLAGIHHMDGFVIPKTTADVLPAYIAAMPHAHQYMMPTIETREAFDPIEMRRLREQLTAIQDRVLAIRIGGNDLLRTLSSRRSLTRTAYDGPLGNIIAILVSSFIPWGFSMSAPVLENFNDMQLLQEEVDRDIEHGLLTKTAVHPDQVSMIHRAYMVDERNYANALQILDDEAPAVFAVNGVMSEPATHRGWARAIVTRASFFGVRPGPEYSSADTGLPKRLFESDNFRTQSKGMAAEVYEFNRKA